MEFIIDGIITFYFRGQVHIGKIILIRGDDKIVIKTSDTIFHLNKNEIKEGASKQEYDTTSVKVNKKSINKEVELTGFKALKKGK